MAVLDGVLFIPCYFKHLGWELHRLSESGDAIELELDVYPGGASSTPSLFTLHDSEVFFAADDGVQGGALWKYNSTHGATLAATISPNVDLSAGVGMVSFGKALVFAADYPGAGIEPVKFDPVTSQVTLLADIEQGPTGVSAKHFCVLGSRLFFTVFDTSSTSRLYQYSDAGGASEVQSSPENPSYLAAVGNVLFMAGSDSAHGAELWKFTEQGGAELARDIKAGPSSSSPVQLEAGAHVLFMVAETDSSPSSNRPRLCSYNPSTDEFHDSVEPVFLGVTMLMPFSNSVLFRAMTHLTLAVSNGVIEPHCIGVTNKLDNSNSNKLDNSNSNKLDNSNSNKLCIAVVVCHCVPHVIRDIVTVTEFRPDRQPFGITEPSRWTCWKCWF
ncbi:hypothetical protein FNF29_08480 [Cafeteria roenbergensis]|uniref:Uncharacterized protein n=1 Tax=Cafeteria roenbergensis TaxID=33653 RepID=A0A5A8BXW5_CAFRO|nr:hypothetical protein FNF29_08480 [Cafeteria roenbergensis]|eukprot:KAA0145566.1 hypothetical protein FNF29_08480 [Cafeteria roenbergensis]